MSLMYTNLKFAREDFGYSVRGFAELLEIDPSTVSKYEKGIRGLPVDLVKYIANYLDCSYDFIMQESDYGLFAYYNDKKISLSINQYIELKNKGLIKTVDYTRFIEDTVDSSFIEPLIYRMV